LRWPELAWTGLVVAVMLVMLVLTQSRGALLAAAGIVILLIGLRWRRGWLLVALIVMGIGIAGYFWGWSNTVTFLTAGTSAAGADGRVELWSRGIFMVQDFSFTGIGMGSYGPVADLIYPFFLFPAGMITHVHNLFLQVAIDLGIPGLVMWLAAWMLVMVLAWQVYRRGRVGQDRWLAGLGAGLLAGQLALGIHGLLDGVTWGIVRSAPLVWLLWGVVVAARCICEERSDEAISS
jgi:putative inorganic carbon (HCO3(-)) transporter